MKIYKCANLSLIDWHRRMGHLNLEYVKKLESMAEGIEIMDKRNTQEKCETCIQAKSTRASFTKKGREKETAVGHTVSADLGFISNKAFSGERANGTSHVFRFMLSERILAASCIGCSIFKKSVSNQSKWYAEDSV